MVAPMFVHLRVHSSYSLTQSTMRIPALLDWANKGGQPALALTDKGNLFGALEFATLMMQKGVQPIHGVVLRFKSILGAQPLETNQDELLLIAQNERGFQNLMALVSQGYLDTSDGEPVLPLSALAERTQGLIALTGTLESGLGRALLANQRSLASQHLDWLQTQFEGRLYIELQRHGLPRQRQLEPLVLAQAYERGIPLVATNAAHFLNANYFKAHDALMCIGQSTTIHDENRKTLTVHHSLKSPEEMSRLFADVPEALANTTVIAQRCSYAVATRDPILPSMGSPDEESEQLVKLVWQGFESKWEGILKTWPDQEDGSALRTRYEERLEFELGVITQMGFSGYFLIVTDFIAWSKKNGIPVGPGRGSGAASLVAYSLKITGLDPIPYGLLFERFLNPERISMPDFDIDFCQDRREEVIAYVRETYGADRVAQIITYGSLKARAALRDAGRVLAMPYGQVDRLSKLVPNNPANPVSLKEAIEGEAQIRQEINHHSEVRNLFEIAQQIEGLHRSAGTHAAGIVISDRPITELVPLYQDPRATMPATQFDMKWVEKAGLVKFDFLGLKTLSILQQIEVFARDRGKPIAFETVPLDDPEVYCMICQCKTVGVFQLESSGMQSVISDLQPDRFTDIIALVALYRPGPMDNIPDFVARKSGKAEIKYLHPKLEEVVSETYGIMIYQEQVLQAARVLAGYTLGSADFLRKAMGKKIKSEMDKQRETFVSGAKLYSDIDAPLANEIFDQIASFAGYGFNKAHSASYGLIAYQTAFARRYFPAEFYAANMNYDMSSTDRLAVFTMDLRSEGLELLLPNINSSDALFRVKGDTQISYGLAAIKGVGLTAMQALVAERLAGGSFQNMRDFAIRAAPFLNKKQLEQLILAGALDCLHPNRAEVYYALEHILNFGQTEAAERNSAQESLFQGDGAGIEMALNLREAPDWDAQDRLNREREVIGFYLSAHPLDHRESDLERLKVSPLIRLLDKQHKPKSSGRIAGIIVNTQERRSAKGKKFAFLAISDATATVDIMVFEDLLARKREQMVTGVTLIIDVTLDDQGEKGVRFVAQSIDVLEELLNQKFTDLKIYVSEVAQLSHIRSMLSQAEAGRGAVQLVCDLDPQTHVTLRLTDRVRVDQSLANALTSIDGLVVERHSQDEHLTEKYEFVPYTNGPKN